MASSYNLNKATILQFFKKRLNDTFGGKLVVMTSRRAAGTEESPKLWVCVDSVQAKTARSAGTSGIPEPLSFSVVVETDGSGAGTVVVKPYDIRYSGKRMWNNSGHNFTIWGFKGVSDDNNIPKSSDYVKKFTIKDYDVFPAMRSVLNWLRFWSDTISAWKPTGGRP